MTRGKKEHTEAGNMQKAGNIQGAGNMQEAAASLPTITGDASGSWQCGV